MNLMGIVGSSTCPVTVPTPPLGEVAPTENLVKVSWTHLVHTRVDPSLASM